MKKISVLFASLVLVFAMSSSAMALLTNETLSYYAATAGGIVQPTYGSWFSMLALDLTLDTIPETNVYTPISSFNGIKIGQLQPASGSHSGGVNGTESPDVGNPWVFFTNTGMHQIIGTAVTDNGDGTLNMSGWNVTWNGIPSIPMGGDSANFPVDTGKGTITIVGSSYTLDHSAHVPLNNSSGFGGVPYSVHLEGTISAIPEPASLLLIGSGLVGILGLARKKK